MILAVKLNLDFLKTSPKLKDINFFELRKKKQAVALTGLILVLVPVVLLGSMFAVYSYNSYRINVLNERLRVASENLAAINLKEKQPILERATVKRDIFATYYAWVDSLNTQLGNYKTVPSELLVDLENTAKNTEVECIGIEARENSMIYKGRCHSTNVVASYQEKCSALPNVKDAFVNLIEKKDADVEPQLVDGRFIYTDTYEFEMTVNYDKNVVSSSNTETDNDSDK